VSDSTFKMLRPWLSILVLLVVVFAAAILRSVVGVLVFMLVIFGVPVAVYAYRNRSAPKDRNAGMPAWRMDQAFGRKKR
jgi:hypothetical protein